MLKQMKKALAILLAVCFMVTVTAGAVSAHADDNGHYVVHEDHHKQVHKPVIKSIHKQVHKPVIKTVYKTVTKPAPETRP